VHFFRGFLISFISLAAAPAGAAEALHIKTGLWEMRSSEMHSDRALLPPISDEDFAQMPASRQAQFESLRRAGKTALATYKTCITSQMLQSFRPSELAADCTSVLLKGTSSQQHSHIACAGGRETGVMQLKAETPESVVIDVTLFARDGKRSVATGTHMEGRWISAECGQDGK